MNILFSWSRARCLYIVRENNNSARMRANNSFGNIYIFYLINNIYMHVFKYVYICTLTDIYTCIF